MELKDVITLKAIEELASERKFIVLHRFIQQTGSNHESLRAVFKPSYKDFKQTIEEDGAKVLVDIDNIAGIVDTSDSGNGYQSDKKNKCTLVYYSKPVGDSSRIMVIETTDTIEKLIESVQSKRFQRIENLFREIDKNSKLL